MNKKQYYVYIMASKSKMLYTGVTNNLQRRVWEHKNGRIPGYTSKYNINKLVFYDAFSDVKDAITAEKKIKGWLRRKKIELIKSDNPNWDDLSAKWFLDS